MSESLDLLAALSLATVVSASINCCLTCSCTICRDLVCGLLHIVTLSVYVVIYVAVATIAGVCGITLILTSRYGYFLVIAVSCCLDFCISCVVTNRTELVSLVSDLGTGRSLSLHLSERVAVSLYFFVCCVITNRTELVSLVSDLSTGRSLSLHLSERVAVSLYFFVCCVITNRTELVSLVSDLSTGRSLSLHLSERVAVGLYFFVCCVITNRASDVSVPADFSTRCILGVVRNLGVSKSVNGISVESYCATA